MAIRQLRHNRTPIYPFTTDVVIRKASRITVSIQAGSR
jgi:hypothetical protein